MYTPLRDDLMEALTDDELGFTPGGSNPSLGELCREIGETEYAYIQSFKTLQTDFSYRRNDDEYLGSVQKLKAWYQEMDAELEAVLQTITDEDVASKQIDRGGYEVPLPLNLDIYREALLIFYGKVSVYTKAMNKPLSQMWHDWIG